VSWHVRVITNRYADSVRLMGVAREVRGSDGVAACEVLMGTPANVGALAALGADVAATPADIVIAVDAGADSAAGALDRAEQALAARGSDAGAREVARPRSLRAAARELDGANVALISVPGEYATLEAHRALSEGMHVFLFSDHVSVADELELKRRGAELGLLVMGPECGTAMLGGIGLGFANVVRPGSVGIVAAAGTGAQESACLLDAAGAGVAQIVGVGGRDLSERIGGIMFRQAMAMLGRSDDVDTLLLVSKQPTPEVVRTLGESAPDGVRVVGAFVGWDGGEGAFEIHPTLEEAARAAAGGGTPAEVATDVADLRERARRRPLLGLFSGGSLAHEAATIAQTRLGPVGGNVGDGDAGGHAIFDLGEEDYTRGRPQPMVDLGVRLELLEEAAATRCAGAILLDVVLGHGAHPDPASELAPAIERAAADAVVVAHVCGTEADPQDAGRQETTLAGAGAVLAPSNAAAARLAVEVVA
jgi:FdrA protein